MEHHHEQAGGEEGGCAVRGRKPRPVEPPAPTVLITLADTLRRAAEGDAGGRPASSSSSSSSFCSCSPCPRTGQALQLIARLAARRVLPLPPGVGETGAVPWSLYLEDSTGGYADRSDRRKAEPNRLAISTTPSRVFYTFLPFTIMNAPQRPSASSSPPRPARPLCSCSRPRRGRAARPGAPCSCSMPGSACRASPLLPPPLTRPSSSGGIQARRSWRRFASRWRRGG